MQIDRNEAGKSRATLAPLNLSATWPIDAMIGARQFDSRKPISHSIRVYWRSFAAKFFAQDAARRSR
jgi:hypothetical protein